MINSQNLKAAQDVHHKLEFYLVALAFTIVGFSIQTGKFSGIIFADIAEVVSWILMILSGLAGLSRIEYIPVLYRNHDDIRSKELCIEDYKDQQEYAEELNDLQTQVNETKPKLIKIEERSGWKYKCQKLCFLLGLLSLLIARVIFQIDCLYL